MDDNKNINTKGCGFLIIDFLAVALCGSLLIHNGTGLHIVFSILIGVAITVIFICLTRLPYIGRLLQASLGLVWGRIVYAFLDSMFHYNHSKDVGLMTGLYENDKIMWWTIVIIINLIFIAIHISAFSNHIGTMNFRRKTKSVPYSGGYEIYDSKSYTILDNESSEMQNEVMFSDEVSDMEDKPYKPY
ncbi:MAG: hypothetical protein NC452_17185 [Eubacterium sp.]|nr:hypothetical protein [Eubacterium sp.]